MKQNTIPALLAVIAVLLGLNLLPDTPSMAQPVPQPKGKAVGLQVAWRVPGFGASAPTFRHPVVYRLWEDGTVETTRYEASPSDRTLRWTHWEKVGP